MMINESTYSIRKTRLIDADALCEYIEKEFDGVCVYDVSGNEAAREFCDMVDIAPTVDAITVEWLLKKKASCIHMSNRASQTAWLIDDLIKEWQKEIGGAYK